MAASLSLSLSPYKLPRELQTVLCFVMLCYCCAMLLLCYCYAIAMLCYAMLCYAMLCYAVQVVLLGHLPLSTTVLRRMSVLRSWVREL